MDTLDTEAVVDRESSRGAGRGRTGSTSARGSMCTRGQEQDLCEAANL
jgi:hypothetical protein